MAQDGRCSEEGVGREAGGELGGPFRVREDLNNNAY